MKHYQYGNMYITLFENGKFVPGLTRQLEQPGAVSMKRANFEVNISGGTVIELGERGFLLRKCVEKENGLELYYDYGAEGLSVQVVLEYIEGTDVIVQRNYIENKGRKPQKITRFSSASIDHILDGPEESWFEKEGAGVYICHNKWQGEGQWRRYEPKDLGLYPTSVHTWERASCRIQSVGSWSTGNFYPMAVIEDSRNNRAWYMETEGSHSWYIKLCAYGGYAEPDLSMECSCCDEGNGGWYYDLNPGETYAAQRSFWGVTEGGFAEAAANLNAFKRKDALVHAQNGTMPLVFNDYMDCVWSDQRPETLKPLIDRAARIGCEVFCIDGGWSENRYGKGLGDWIPNQTYYKDCTLEELAAYIRNSGMFPGIWLELETCNATAFGAELSREAVLKRYGNEIGGEKWFYNFKDSKVREYLAERVDVLYRMGFRYIKNDYNHSMGIGCTNNYQGESPAEGMIQNNNAFLDFIDSLYQKYPDLTIENCGSGALRSDNKMLRHFDLQSISDQEQYENNPSILMGSAAVMPPEKVGIWVYPYPVSFSDYYDFVPDKEYRKRMESGMQTAFNMVSGLMGSMYLSGRIDLCDERNLSLIEDGIRLYKKIRKDISSSAPIYPTGLHGINEKEIFTFGLLVESRLMFAAWNLSGKEAEGFEIDLGKWMRKEGIIKVKYPKLPGLDAKMEGRKLILNMPAESSAVFLRIDL